MNGLTGMEKFSHLEDKIYLTIEYAKKLREEKERFETEAFTLRRDASNIVAENSALREKLSVLLTERETIQRKVDAMLDSLSLLGADVAEAAGK